MTKPTSNSPKTATGSPGSAQPGTTPASSVKIVPAAEKVPIPSPLPKTWTDIQVGSLVIAEEALEYGWWHAVVTEVRAAIAGHSVLLRALPGQNRGPRRRADLLPA